jgi:hypothetical protein
MVQAAKGCDDSELRLHRWAFPGKGGKAPFDIDNAFLNDSFVYEYK